MKTKKASLLLNLAVSFTLLLFAGCATSDSHQQTQAKDKRPIEERLKVGMTKEEVHAAIGEPAGKSVNSNGLECWNYNDNAKAWIPFYAMGGGKFQHLTVNFDADGKVKDWSSSKQGMY